MKNFIEDAQTRFIVGMAMLIAGMWMFLKKVYVASNFFSSGVHLFGVTIRSGVLVVPLLAALIWLFFKPQSKAAKWGCVAGIAVIVLFAVSSVNIRVSRIPIAKWLLILFLVVVGGILTISGILEKKRR